MWMAGYASRKHPAEGTLHPLWAKALVVEDQRGGRAVLVASDVDRSKPRKRFAHDAVGEFARRLQSLILRYPADWQGWTYGGIRR